MLNESKGNMYPFITHTWNTVKGKCPHDCSYCYMKRFGEQKPMRFTPSELKTDLGEGNFIFVGSSCDMWAKDVRSQWISETLEHCRKFKNKYLFQSKYPSRFLYYTELFPENVVLGTTIETNRMFDQMGKSQFPQERASSLYTLKSNFKTMVTVEPIMNFDVNELVSLINMCGPGWVNIGSDSKGHNLPEPSPGKIKTLIEALKSEGIEVKIKPNLKRLTKLSNSRDTA